MANSSDTNVPSPTELPREEADKAAFRRRTAPPHSLWIDAYGLVLVAVILAYYAAMIYLAGCFLVWMLRLLPNVPAGNITAVLSAALAVLLFFLLVRTIRHLIVASLGLVTRVHDVVPEADEGIPLAREDYAKLFQLIQEVGEKVGSPMPDEIRLIHTPESFTVELRDFGLFPKRRLILVLSLPQMAVLTMDELRVLLAHELSHFGRGDTRFIVFCARFLASLERSIDAIGHRWWHWIDPIYWFQRGYHRAFALLSAPVQRHQELRADCISAAVYGGELAARTLLKDSLLSLQFMSALASYEPSDNGRAGTFFQWFRNQWHDFSPSGQDYLLERFDAEEKASFWDPDPTLSQRVALMRSFPEQPVESAQPASELLGDLPALEERLDAMMYADDEVAADDES